MLLHDDTLTIARAELRLQQCFLRNNYQFKFMGYWFINPYIWLKERGQRKALKQCVRIVSDLLFEAKIQKSSYITPNVYKLFRKVRIT